MPIVLGLRMLKVLLHTLVFCDTIIIKDSLYYTRIENLVLVDKFYYRVTLTLIINHINAQLFGHLLKR